MKISFVALPAGWRNHYKREGLRSFSRACPGVLVFGQDDTMPVFAAVTDTGWIVRADEDPEYVRTSFSAPE